MSKIQDNYKQLEDEDETLDLLLEKYKIDYGFIGSVKSFFNKNKNYFIDRKHNRTVLKNEIKKQKKLVKELDRKSENASKFSFKEIKFCISLSSFNKSILSSLFNTIFFSLEKPRKRIKSLLFLNSLFLTLVKTSLLATTPIELFITIGYISITSGCIIIFSK